MSGLPERERAIFQRLKDNFPHYAPKCLRIRPKKGEIIAFELNGVQHEIHARLERQLAETGRVRALILKARQPGCSTYVEGRYYWKVTQRHGVRAFILTHTQDATDNLFGMVERFHENCPVVVCPQTGKSNAKELAFPLLDSGYRVGTAGTEGVGRSDTIQYFHGSEVAYWKNADSHMAGVLQAVPEEPGTEIILESTANGLGGLFYSMCKAAERGESDYTLIFLPWFWHDEYRKPVPEGWQPPTDFHQYAEIHGLDPEQVHWAYAKNRDLTQSVGADSDKICWKFRQESPATAEEAFQTGSVRGLGPLVRALGLVGDPQVELVEQLARGSLPHLHLVDQDEDGLGNQVGRDRHADGGGTIVLISLGELARLPAERGASRLGPDAEVGHSGDSV